MSDQETTTIYTPRNRVVTRTLTENRQIFTFDYLMSDGPKHLMFMRNLGHEMSPSRVDAAIDGAQCRIHGRIIIPGAALPC